VGDEYMNNAELIKYTVEEFSRLQQYMQAVECGLKAFNLMKARCIELKVILQASGLSSTDIDIIEAGCKNISNGCN